MAEAVSRAVGVVEGTFIPERHMFVAADGAQYRASGVSSLEKKYRSKPQEFAGARFHVVYPRTIRGGVELIVASSPTDPERQASLQREAGWFTVSGTVTNQRSRRNQVVLRVVRNKPAPPNRKRQSEFRPHLMFLSGRAAPAADFTNHHATFGCQLVGQELVIRRIEGRSRIRMEPMEAGGVQWPWPFHPGKAALMKLREFNTTQTTFLVRPPYQDTLAEGLKALGALIDHRKNTLHDPADVLVTDRLQLIKRRIRTYASRMGDFELHDLLEETGAHVIMGRISLDTQTAQEPVVDTPTKAKKTKAKAATPAAPAVPPGLEALAEGLLQGWPDLLLRDLPGMSTSRLRSGIAQLVACGWYDTLTPEQQALARTSYQIKKTLKCRP